MGAPSIYYCDPTVAADGGNGTLATPWTRADGGVIRYALDTIVRDTTNGDRLRVIAGTAHAADAGGIIDLATIYGTPTVSAPLWIESCDASGATVFGGHWRGSSASNCFNATYHYCHLHNLRMQKLAAIVGVYGSVIGCEITETVGSAISTPSGYTLAVGNYIHSAAGSTINAGIAGGSGSHILRNWIDARGYGYGIRLQQNFGIADSNVVIVSGTGHGVWLDIAATQASNNTIIGNGSSGNGIHADGTADPSVRAYNNIIAGFAKGIYGAANPQLQAFFANSLYDNTTATDINGDAMVYDSRFGNETLGASPFADYAGGDYAPVDVGDVLSPYGQTVGGVALNSYRGAIPPAAAGGGSPAGYSLARLVQ